MKPRIFINIDTYAIGGPGKGLIQFLKHGGQDLSDPLVVGFWRGAEKSWPFRDAVEATGAEFKVLLQRFAFDPMAIFNARKLIEENRIELLQSHGYKSHVVCLALKIMTGLPWVAFVHGWTSENLKVGLYNLLEKVIVRFADRIVPVSANLGQRLYLGRWGKKKVRIITNAVEIPPAVDSTGAVSVREQFGISQSDFLVGVVGRLSPEKGHIYLVEAIKVIAVDYPEIKVMFVGDGQELSTLERAVKENSLDGNFFMAGYRSDLHRFYNDFDCVVIPSLSEGMPNAALEAMAAGKPVIASRVGGIPDVVIDGVTGCLVPAKSPAALAERIIDLYRDRDKCRLFGIAGFEKVKSEFGPEERVRRIVSMYDELIRFSS